MDFESRLSISYYREIAAINQEHHIHLVQHIKNHKFFVKKTMDVYHIDVYRQLKNQPAKGIPRIYELFEEDGRLTVIEEFISGSTLEELLTLHGTLEPDLAADYMKKLCDIISYLHHMTPVIIHRDIKLSNIMITPFGNLVLLDYNAAKYVDTEKTSDTVLLGTQGYAAPEQYGFGSSNEQTDIYGAGVVLNLMLTGELPSVKKADGPFSSIIEKSTKLRPEDRYDSIDAFKKAVQKAVPSENDILPFSEPYLESWLPPGFRSRNLFHMITAAYGYGMILWVGSSLIIENVTPGILLFERILMTLTAILLVFFTFNYRNIWRRFPFCTHKKKPVRFFAILFFDFLIFFSMFMIMAIAESFFM